MNKIMVLGTASGVGKSTVATALCRYYRNKGFKVAPFKALNISLNSYVTEDGLEMGRAQVVQAEACELKPMAYMNPVLLKPSGNNKTQVIVNGKVHSMMNSYKYKELNKELKKVVKETFDKFSKEKLKSFLFAILSNFSKLSVSIFAYTIASLLCLILFFMNL